MRKDKFELIENKLSNLLSKLGEKEYLNLINENTLLKKYDNILGKIDNGDYPSNYINQISDKELDNIIEYLNKMTT